MRHAARATFRALIRDEAGNVYRSPSYVLISSLSFFFVFGVFLMNVQLAQMFNARDSVDHATARAVDIASKSYCVNGQSASATEAKINAALKPVLETVVGDGDRCESHVRPTGSGGDDGTQSVEVEYTCSIKCRIPFAAQAMCQSGRVQFSSKQTTTALGCDGDVRPSCGS